MGAVEVRKTQFDPSAPYEFTITAPRPGNVAVGTEVQLSIVITFDNDLQTSTEDRNLLVDKIIVTPR